MRSIGRVRARDGTGLYCEVLDRGCDRWLVLVHGIGEHCGRGDSLLSVLGERHNLLRYDLRGHGRSEGSRGYVGNFAEHFCDLEDVVRHAFCLYPNLRYDVFGHSMGALVVAGMLQGGADRGSLPRRVFLASPPVGIGGFGGSLVNRIPQCFFRALCRLPVSLPLSSAFNRSFLSHDAGVVERLDRDPLSLKRLHSKLALGLVAASKDVFSRPLAVPVELFGAVGSADRIVSPVAAKRYFREFEPRADFRVFEGAYHELHHEVARYREPYFDFLRYVFGS